jgi:hypothetical protein
MCLRKGVEINGRDSQAQIAGSIHFAELSHMHCFMRECGLQQRIIVSTVQRDRADPVGAEDDQAAVLAMEANQIMPAALRAIAEDADPQRLQRCGQGLMAGRPGKRRLVHPLRTCRRVGGSILGREGSDCGPTHKQQQMNGSGHDLGDVDGIPWSSQVVVMAFGWFACE